jgi:hypothetical protein
MDEPGTDDGFEDLRGQLPRFQGRPLNTGNSPREDEFQDWLIARFDRIGHMPIRELISTSFSHVKSHLIVFCIAYLFFLSVAFVAYSQNRFLMIFWLTICSLSAFVSLFLVRRRLSFRYFFTPRSLLGGICMIISLFVTSVCQVFLVFEIVQRSSFVTCAALIVIAVEFVFFFVPCLYLDNLRLGWSQIYWFSWKISVFQGNSFYVLAFVIGHNLMILISPVTFGLSFWLSFSMRINFYYNLCGTSSSSTVSHV